jgi:predicted N-acetyltransferase YhbS
MTAVFSPPEAVADDLVFAPERPEDGARVDALIDAAFGPGRFAKAAERLREGNHPRLDLSFCAWHGSQLAGAVRQWPVLIGETPVIFLGPFAVDPQWRRRKLGRRLIARACEAAAVAGERLVLLVGDASYFGPLGFEQVPAGRLAFPGPVDPRRILWRALGPAALDDVAGPVVIPRD